jgi:DNA-binding transcriptional LysR family regulator
LQSLETMLGVRLLLRTTHTTRLTDDGERCYQHARRVIDSWLALEDEVGQTEDEPVGVLRVRAPHAFGQDQLLKPVTEFLQRYPQLSIEWMLNDRSADFLGDNLDCAIRVGVEVDPATVSVLLAEVPRSVVASPALLARFPAVNAGGFAAVSWIAISSFYQRHVELFHDASSATARIAITPRLSTDSLYVARNTALTGLGVAVVSSWTVQEDIREGRLVHLLPVAARGATGASGLSLVPLLSGTLAAFSGVDAAGHAGGDRDEKARAAAIKKPTRRSAFYFSVVIRQTADALPVQSPDALHCDHRQRLYRRS